MLHNINKICNQENIESITNEEMALEGYALEIVKMLKGKQQGIIRGEEERREKRARKEKELEKETEKEKQELKRKEQEMQERSLKSEKK